MARPGKWDHLKPEIMRLIQEGFGFAELHHRYPKIAKGTLHNWIKSFEPRSERSERGSKPRPRLPIDPESPIEKVRNALWDIVQNPEGKGVAVQALNAILKSFEVEAKLATYGNDDETEESKPVINVNFK